MIASASRRARLGVVATFCLVAACGSPRSQQAPPLRRTQGDAPPPAAMLGSGPPSGTDVAAEWPEGRVTVAELDARAGARLAEVRQKEYDIRRRMLGELLAERGKTEARVLLEPPRLDVRLLSSLPSLGATNAPVTLLEFSDYQCPYCHRAQQTVERLLETYGARLRFVHADFPLDAHTRAIFASRASRCAADQSKYWEYHKDLLRNPTDFSDGDLHERAKRLGLDTGAFDACVASDRKDADIDAARRLGLSLNVDGTPAFYINGRALTGARPYEELRALIDEELAVRGQAPPS